jgi:hypothetical protein
LISPPPPLSLSLSLWFHVLFPCIVHLTSGVCTECNSIMSSSAHLGGCFVYVRKQLHCLHLEHFFRLQMISIGYWMR